MEQIRKWGFDLVKHDFYRLLREATGDMVIIGGNTILHLCAGLVELYRGWDDTSGREWSRTVGLAVQ